MTDHSSPENAVLLPCPFCGGEAQRKHGYWIECGSCGVGISAPKEDISAVGVAKRWNGRALGIRAQQMPIATPQQVQEACAMVADRAVQGDLDWAARYPDEALKYEERAHRAKTIASSIRALIPALTSPECTCADSHCFVDGSPTVPRPAIQPQQMRETLESARDYIASVNFYAAGTPAYIKNCEQLIAIDAVLAHTRPECGDKP